MDLKKIILEYQDFIKEVNVVKRNYTIDIRGNYVITGIRRAGKTWFLFQVIKEFFHPHYENVLYINFEDDRFIDFKVTDFDRLLNAYDELYPGTKPVLFLDEIQNIEGWHKFCRRVADQKYRVYITGSNANMLSSDIASTLGARFLQMEITPLSFSEFLKFQNVSFSEKDFYRKKINLIKNRFGDYFHHGGFPEIIGINNKREYLHNIFSTILYTDVVIKNKIRDIGGIKLLVKKLAESTNDELSYNRLKNLLGAAGRNTGTPSVISWMETLKDSFLIRELKNINYKFSEKESKKKYYFIDNGLLYVIGETSESKMLETLLFNVLRKINNEIYFYKSKIAEVDFIIPDNALYQASFELAGNTTWKREISSLLKVSKRLKINNMNIVTYDYEEEIRINSKTIKIIPLWKLILEQTIKR